jgi:DNA-binding HxlR family transcriptional regulator
MAKPDKIEWSGCPVRYAAGVFGDKWSFVLLRDVLLHGKRYYGDFLGSDEGISTNILADRLGNLVQTGMLTRHVDPHKRSKVYYLPTQKSIALLPAFIGMMVWSVTYDEKTEAPDSFATAFDQDPKGTIAWYENRIREVNAQIAAPRN